MGAVGVPGAALLVGVARPVGAIRPVVVRRLVADRVVDQPLVDPGEAALELLVPVPRPAVVSRWPRQARQVRGSRATPPAWPGLPCERAAGSSTTR